MKLRNVFVFSVFMVVLIGPFLGIAYPVNEERWDSENFGKVIIQIIDQDTLKPVNEEFSIELYDSKKNIYPANLIETKTTDKNGRLTLELVPYIYYLQFWPTPGNSKYCVSPYPYFIKAEDRPVIKVEPGKITYFQKKVTSGGILKIYTADMNNVRFNPQEKFKQEYHIGTFVNCNDIYIGVNVGQDDLNDGALTIKKLHPGVYWIGVEFRGLGYIDVEKNDITVYKDKITEVIINVNLADNTGIEGVITDANGTPLDNADLTFSPRDRAKIGQGFVAMTDSNGYYKIQGMPEGSYYVWYGYNCKTKGKGTISAPYGYIEIIKGILKNLNIQFKYTREEMENR